ncbi:MAG: cob(I)yrinic acid a,c-diamide adenosyltransferase [Candidatus Promineifilaceae bacterium]
MPRLTRIYTKSGDDGTTGLGSRTRVAKDDQRVRAYGDVDELNAAIGLARSFGLDDRLQVELADVQNELFHLGSDLAFPIEVGEAAQVPRIEEGHVARLESLIDKLSAEVGPLRNFILPGGSTGASALHLARTVCRRAERQVVCLSHVETINPLNLVYLNRLSDALFVMARFENHQKSVPEPLWDSRA